MDLLILMQDRALPLLLLAFLLMTSSVILILFTTFIGYNQ